MQTLADIVAERGPLPVREAIGWTLRAAMTLWALHAEGMVHGRVSIVAIMAGGIECRSDGLLVRPSQLDDDVAYHSPARSDGEGPSKEDDVWALGITLYYALTAKLPYPRGVKAAIEKGRLRAPPPLAVYRSTLDVMQPVLDRIIRADRSDRLTHIEDVVAGLRELSPTIADLDPLSIDQAFTEKDLAPSVKPPRNSTQAALGSLAPPPQPPAKDATQATLIALAGMVALGVAIFIAWSTAGGGETTADRAGPPHSATHSGGPRASAPHPSALHSGGLRSGTPYPSYATTSPSAKTAPAPSSTSSTSEPAPVVPPAPVGSQDLVACTADFFAAGAFDSKRVTRDFPCGENDAVAGMDMLTGLLAQGSAGQSSDATREWSNLGWYRIAAYAVARAICCDAGAPLKSSGLYGVCNLDGAIEELTKSVLTGSDDEVGIALKRYGGAASCIDTAGGSRTFGVAGQPTAGHAAIFLRMVSRLRAKRRG